MTIYLNKTESNIPFQKLAFLHQKIHSLVKNNLQDTIPQGFDELCLELGHSAGRVQQLWDLCYKVHSEPLTGEMIHYSEDLTGVYRLINGDKVPVAVFKIGSRRAATEILASELAHRIGLGNHFINGTFCALEKLPRSLAPLLIQLWNGNFAEYSLNPKKMVGIIEEFATDGKIKDESEQEAFLKMVTLALAIGLRDAKKDGITNGSFIIFDADQCFPRRIDPIFSDPSDASAAKELVHQPAATDLQFLADYEELAKKPIPKELVSAMRQIVEAWDLKTIKEFLEHQPIHFPDLEAETNKSRDDVGNKLTIVDDPDELKELSDRINVLAGFNNKKPVFEDLKFSLKDNMLTKEQIQATIERLTRIKKFFAETVQPTSNCIDLIKGVDPYWAKLVEESFLLLFPESKTPDISDREISEINKQVDRWASNRFMNLGSISPFSLSRNSDCFNSKASKMKQAVSEGSSVSPAPLDLRSSSSTPTNFQFSLSEIAVNLQ